MTWCARFVVTVHGHTPTPSPLQPTKIDPGAGVAWSVTAAPPGNVIVV
jgi:hypothetical protein